MIRFAYEESIDASPSEPVLRSEVPWGGAREAERLKALVEAGR